MAAGSRVRVLCDLDGKYLRGSKQVCQGRTVYVGTGVALLSREELFSAEPSSLRSVPPFMLSLFNSPYKFLQNCLYIANSF